ncbi:hypothetical protein NPX13_g8878 [Xylaria arbuscula]|uniref:Ribosomal protein L9 domain-containing protein n=1 Tax=Xylaria arbuscula TaxID=114810 RepID=A0A9W8N7K7_9PEZI|nr:hypothetical protein NPX13_g8878 [Xylaria arbuscula]
MATPWLARSSTCIGCLRRLAPQQSYTPSPLSWTQTRAKATKAELEDLQGIPVRLLRDIKTFGRRHRKTARHTDAKTEWLTLEAKKIDAIIRVKPGRMRNIWFPKGQAEYMTKQRFTELGLSEAAIGVRDRTFGTLLVLEEEADSQKASTSKRKLKEVLTLSVREPQS